LFDQAAELELSHSDDVAKQFRELPIPASQFHHESIRKGLSSFDELSPFGRDKTYMSLVAHVSDSGVRYRERFAHGLARNDSLFLFDGGWMLPLGQEEAFSSFARTYRQLPLRRFATVTAKSVQVRPLMIRRLDHDGETYFYLVNDSPWDVGVDLRFDTSDRNLTMRSLGVNRSDRLEASGEQYVWSLNVEPYELIAVAMSSPKVELVDGISTLPPDVDRALDQRIEALTSRSRYLGKPKPLPTLANADFEKPSDQQLVPSWQPALVSTGQVGLGNGYKSGRSLTIATDQESLAVRSSPFARPDNGQLAIEFAAKFSASDDETNQLGTRIVVESAGSEVAYWNEGEMRISELADGWSKVILPVKSLTIGTGELSLRIELAKSRHLQIDNVRIYDTLLLDPDELRTLSTKISLADFMRRRGYYADCNRFLNSYWPQYLMQFVPEAPQVPPTMTRRPQPQRKPIRTSDRWKRYIPRFPGMR
jgi:hypothetical protein